MIAQIQNSSGLRQRLRLEFATLAAMTSNFENLKVWKNSVELVKDVYRLSDEGFDRRDWDLTRQVRRAAISIISNIAEGAERDNPREFVRFLTYAKGSCGEVRAQMILARELDFISWESFAATDKQCKSISRMLYKLIEYLKKSNI